MKDLKPTTVYKGEAHLFYHVHILVRVGCRVVKLTSRSFCLAGCGLPRYDACTCDSLSSGSELLEH